MRANVGWLLVVGLNLTTTAIAVEPRGFKGDSPRTTVEDGTGLTNDALETLRRPRATGLFVFAVLPGSTAEKAGIRAGDILTHYDGQAVETHLDLTRLARLVNDEKRDEVLLVLRRSGQEIDITVPPGPLGVRLEDVVAGEVRAVPSESMPPAHSDHSWFERILNSGGQRWMLISAYGDGEAPHSVGWMRHSFSKKSDGEGSLHIHQYLQQSKIVIQQEVFLDFSLDACLSIRQMRLTANDKLVLDVRAQGEKWVGTRAGVLVENPLSPQTVSAYLAPYIALSYSGSGTQRLSCRYLPPGSLESAPLSEIVVVQSPPTPENSNPRAGFRICKLGREEMRGSISDDGELGAILLRGGLRIEPASEEEVRAAFPDST